MSEGSKSARARAARGEGRIGLPHPTIAPKRQPNAARRRSGASWHRGRGRFAGWLSALRQVFGHKPGPRERPGRLALPPIETAADIAAMLAAITTAVHRGSITPAEAAGLAAVADTYIRVIEAGQYDRRLQALEAAHAAKP